MTRPWLTVAEETKTTPSSYRRTGSRAYSYACHSGRVVQDPRSTVDRK